MNKEYFQELSNIFSRIEATGAKGNILPLAQAEELILKTLKNLRTAQGKLIFIGNGGSAALASHLATDFLRNAGMNSITFNDPVLITTISNDFGYEQVFAKPLEAIAQEGDILFALSSSGKSKNILNAVRKARDKRCFIVTLSGFTQDNPLRQMGDINIYAPSHSYGYVEIAHLSLCHSLAEQMKA